MQYLLLIYESEAEWEKLGAAGQEPMYAEYRQLIQQLSADGKFVGGHQLTPISTATTVRLRNGKKVITDGPFAETKEQLGGYFLVDVGNLDEAIAIAARIPTARD